MGQIRLVRSLPGQGLEGIVEDFVVEYQRNPFKVHFILPSPAIRDEIKRRVVDKGIPIFGASICTLEELAQYFFDHLNCTDSRLDNYTNELILLNVLENNRQQLRLFNGAWGNVQSMVPEIRAFLETVHDFLADYPHSLGDLQSRRSEQLALIRDLYSEFLSSNHLVDRGRMLDWVTEAIERGAMEIDHAVFYGFHEPKLIEKRLIQAIANISGEVHYCIPYVRDCKAFADDGSWLSSESIEEVQSGKEDMAITSLYSPHSRLLVNKIVTGVFRDPLDEVRAVAREIRSLIISGVEAGRITIMLPLRSKVAHLVREVLEDHGIPYNLHLDTPLSESPLVMSLLDILEAVLSDYDRDAVIRLLSSPYFNFHFTIKGEEHVLRASDVSEHSLKAGIIGGRDAWSSSLRSLAAQIREEMEAAEDERTAGRLKLEHKKIELVEGGIHHLFSLLSRLDGKLTIKQRADALRSILNHLDLVKNIEENDQDLYESEVRALSKFLSILDAMEMGENITPSGEIDLSEFLARLRLLASTEGFYERDDNRNAVQVAGLRDSYLVRYDYVFIIGMVDGDIPYLAAGNAFIREREAIKMGLLSKHDLLRHERFYFLSALLSSNIRTYVSRPETNGKDMLVPSCFFEDLERAFEMGSFGQDQEESSSLCCQSIVGQMLSKKLTPEQVRVDLPLPLEEVCQRTSVECLERIGEYDSPYDGVFADPTCIAELGSLLAKRGVYSPSRLESYARCPFRHYLNYVMSIEPVEAIETELTAQERGLLFHRIAYRFYSGLRAQGSTRFTEGRLDELTAQMKSIAEEELDKYHYQGPAWEAFRNSMLGTDARKGLLRAFLEKEVKNVSSLCPRYFELSFGLPLDDDADPSSSREPAEIDLGGEKLKLRCRIDRVDATPDGRFVVLDYKTGASTPSVSSIENGVALQLPRFIQAVENAMPDLKGIGGAYYGVRSENEIDHKCIFGDSEHGDELKPYFGERRKYKDAFAEIIRQSNGYIASYLKGMRAGRFNPNKGPAKCPRGCEYAARCRVDPSRMEGESDDE